ncbi:MAG: MoaD/ThiS family protein, partial [Anaerolineales bacterium]|nr:MoaD/ThiS family protein [Anaerolineales bacterium]
MPEQRIKLDVVLFASLKQAAGVSRLDVTLPAGAVVADLKMHLSQTVPGLESAMHHAVFSVNYEYAEDSVVLPDGAEVAIFPPVSGGAVPTVCLITETGLDLDTLVAQITLPTTGAIVIFTGTVRGVTTRGEAYQTEYLEYEAYQQMAEAK